MESHEIQEPPRKRRRKTPVSTKPYVFRPLLEDIALAEEEHVAKLHITCVELWGASSPFPSSMVQIRTQGVIATTATDQHFRQQMSIYTLVLPLQKYSIMSLSLLTRRIPPHLHPISLHHDCSRPSIKVPLALHHPAFSKYLSCQRSPRHVFFVMEP